VRSVVLVQFEVMNSTGWTATWVSVVKMSLALAC